MQSEAWRLVKEMAKTVSKVYEQKKKDNFSSFICCRLGYLTPSVDFIIAEAVRYEHSAAQLDRRHPTLDHESRDEYGKKNYTPRLDPRQSHPYPLFHE